MHFHTLATVPSPLTEAGAEQKLSPCHERDRKQPLGEMPPVQVRASVASQQVGQYVRIHNHTGHLCLGAVRAASRVSGHTLPHPGLVARRAQHRQAAVRVHVDEAGTDDVPGRVDCARCLNLGVVAAVDGERVALH